MFNRWIEIPAQKSCLLLGPRRAGKTTCLKARYPEYRYVTLDDFDLLSWANSDPKGFASSLGKQAIVDEIQRVPKLTIALKQLIDEEKIHLIMTGSSSIGLLDSSADTLAGRIETLHLPTMCWGEEQGPPTHSFFKDKLELPQLMEAKRIFDVALSYGGFPEIVSKSNSEEKEELLRSYKNSYFTRDLAQLSNIENVEGLLAILQQIMRSLGSHLEVSNFSREAALSHPTAKKYLNVLTQSDLGFKLYGYHFGPAKRYIKAAKMYFADNGIISALGQEINRGQLMENFVISELEKRRKLRLIKCEQFFYYKSTSNTEIDLLFEEEGVLHAVEIKSSANLGKKDLRNLREYGDPKGRKIRKYIVYTGLEYYEEDGISIIPVFALYRSW